MAASPPGRQNETEHVGAPTEYADAVEVPDWAATLTKVLFFLPAALLTATTIPIIVVGLVLLLFLACGLLSGLM